MFFPERIKSITSKDRVLEIGPGGNAHPRSDVLLEKKFICAKEAEAQRGYTPELQTNKKIVYFDGKKIPFKENFFDYVICSHVLEHVEDIDDFILEINRVAKRGYFEYPLVYYDFVYNFPEHITILKKVGTSIVWMSKKEMGLSKFKPINAFFYESLKNGYTSLVDNLKDYFFEGYEWFEEIESHKTDKIEDLVHQNFYIPIKKHNRLNLFQRLREKLKL